ncbi:MAG: hypothetical protein J0L73_09135 [Verrucomicrobia bacterium]|nr:hypothetical protein [Verrucomicrobiota bacterium]
MAKFYFMDQECSGAHFIRLDEALESGDIRLVFEDGWYWFHYCFFGRDCIGSEESDALRTHLLNLVAMLHKHHDLVLEQLKWTEEAFEQVTSEFLAIVDASKAYPISLWIYGDETCKAFLDEKRAELPTAEQMSAFIDLPHFARTRRERPHYRYIDEKMALKRYLNELADFNRRQKLAQKNQQRRTATGGDAAKPDFAV